MGAKGRIVLRVGGGPHAAPLVPGWGRPIGGYCYILTIGLTVEEGEFLAT